MSDAFLSPSSEMGGWPHLIVTYPTSPENIKPLLFPGFELADTSNVTLRFYQMPVGGVPEYGLVVSVDASYKGQKGAFTLAYTIDQEEAVSISVECTGQPKYLGEIDYYRLGEKIVAECRHQDYRFAGYKGNVTGPIEHTMDSEDYEFWVKYQRTVDYQGFDFPPHVVTVKRTGLEVVSCEAVDGELTLRESPWDPVAELLPVEGEVTAIMRRHKMTGRTVEMGDALDAEACKARMDCIGSTRWPGLWGGPKRHLDFGG